ncbi:MAG: hypothetical protein F6K30_00540 [Cyanothece sp. SIO2G6]|nr:hypothetical protein [Cyanothece sp. SIO2G6]
MTALVDPASERDKEIQRWRDKLQAEIEQFYLELCDQVAQSDLREGDIARLGQALLRAKQESIKEIQN